MMIMQFFFLIFFIKAYVVGTHLNCMTRVDAIQMRTHNICLYKKVNKKYTGCNKTTDFHECALIGLCAVIRSNTVSLTGSCTYVCMYVHAFIQKDVCTYPHTENPKNYMPQASSDVGA